MELDGDSNGNSGDNHVFGAAAADNFYRKYGDIDGSGTVNLLDFTQFRQAFASSTADEKYVSGLDSQLDGAINLIDFTLFRQNFGT